MIEPSSITRLVILVSPARSSPGMNSLTNKDYERTLGFKTLQYLVENMEPARSYYYWLIYTKQSSDTAKYIDNYFIEKFCNIHNRLLSISSPENIDEIFEHILNIANLDVNEGQNVYCDCTGGTKTMSIAMVQACNVHNLNANNNTNLNLVFVPQSLEHNRFEFMKLEPSRAYLEEQESYVRQQNRLARYQYLSRFAPILAHEIKNPLNLINADIYLLRGLGLSKQAVKLLNEISGAVQDIADTISSVQQIVREEALTAPEPDINLIQVIRRIQLRTLGKFPDLNLVIEGDFSDLKMNVAEEKIVTVLTNLIDNAANAMNGKGNVSIQIEPHVYDVHITIQDEGPGLPEHIRRNIFKPMQRGDDSTGTGMGLNIIKLFVTDLGGTIRYDDAYSNGTRFWIKLPK